MCIRDRRALENVHVHVPHNIGLQLNLTSETLDSTDQQANITQDILTKWLQDPHSPNPTWGNLIQVLRDIGKGTDLKGNVSLVYGVHIYMACTWCVT